MLKKNTRPSFTYPTNSYKNSPSADVNVYIKWLHTYNPNPSQNKVIVKILQNKYTGKLFHTIKSANPTKSHQLTKCCYPFISRRVNPVQHMLQEAEQSMGLQAIFTDLRLNVLLHNLCKNTSDSASLWLIVQCTQRKYAAVLLVSKDLWPQAISCIKAFHKCPHGMKLLCVTPLCASYVQRVCDKGCHLYILFPGHKRTIIGHVHLHWWPKA